jgi:hypothetical protein
MTILPFQRGSGKKQREIDEFKLIYIYILVKNIICVLLTIFGGCVLAYATRLEGGAKQVMMTRSF